MPNTNPQLLSSVKNALSLLKLFTVKTPEKRLTELAKELGLGKSTTSRLLSTLLSEGFVYQDPITHTYRLGQRIVSLYQVMVTTYMDLAEAAIPIIERLARETSEVLRVAVLEENEVVYIFQSEGQRKEDIAAYIGERNPVHCTSSGKMLLAYQDELALNKLLNRPLTAYTSKTITDPMELKEQLKRIRKQDYCVTFGEIIENWVSISSPLRDSTGQVISALTLIAPMHRMDENRIVSYTNKVVKTAKEISRQFGFIKEEAKKG
ncbi:helix-turn-helix domain-containing protein [Paenibacillus sp. LMG 31458]|uniref:Helix-turn-helix domain-containing protein n=1 Tax=Paenibacillus phytorum TaxID=2654977 RepID=A0ABX1XZ73_9BACL|nr:IclR family transcriptional regulator [Paenibacillus phytorum]NOU73841.1 helix-turn-helix domain-containing protein [Paenibacillus phytorum]